MLTLISLYLAPPSSPLNLQNISVSTTNVSIAWIAPSDNGGRNDVHYTVSITNISEKYNTSASLYTLVGLTPFTTYTIHVTARNGVSDQDSSNYTDRTISITVTTLGIPPSSPQSVTLQITVLTWTAPSNLYGNTLLEYLVLLSTVNDTSTTQVRARLSSSTESYQLSSLDIPEGTYYVWVSPCSGSHWPLHACMLCTVSYVYTL